LEFVRIVVVIVVVVLMMMGDVRKKNILNNITE